ncbi:MAG: DAK2 domain-containing protein [Clostridia bacterium]|nr:DAK2 domain-containing protein [Clostridia bacterium]
MNTMILDGKTLRKMLIGAAANIKNNCNHINDLNVFPIPDGDTGTNMTRTVEGGIAELSRIEDEAPTVSDVTYKFAHGSLLGARGNSGVILSQIFAGIEEELIKFDVVGALEFVKAYRNGIKKAYNAVMNPTEGTILTVFREATEYAAARTNEDSSIEDFLSMHIDEAKRSLARTKDILPVLKEADVVDSGGAGYLCIASGMYAALTGTESFDDYELLETENAPEQVNFDAFTRDSVLEFGYCTEFFLRLQSSKVDPDTFDVKVITDYLESIGGDSIVSYKIDDIVKVHVHTENPGLVLNEVRKWGEMLTVKIENMSLQHNESELGKSEEAKPRTEYATIAVASGEGITELFKSLGADIIISGGQTNNPSAEEFLSAFREANADNIIVLPNNKNILLTAQQAANMWDESKVYIVPTKNLMQGYSALSVLLPGTDEIDVIIGAAVEAASSVIGAEITYAVRDAVIGGVAVKKDEYMSICAGQIKSTAKNAEDAVLGTLEAVEDIDDYEIITIFVGADVDEDVRAELTETIEEKYPDHEVVVYDGGQAVYSYLIAIE